MDINVDEDEPCANYTSKSDGLNKISFSIAAILGGTFGQHGAEQKQVKIEPNQMSCDRTSLFRPFVDYKSFTSNPFNISANRAAFIANSSTAAFFNNFRLSEIFDSTSTKYSHPQNPHHQTKSDNNLKHNNATKYPKILTTTTVDDAQSAGKIAPLGGLNKTISQIGQESSVNKLSQQAKVAADITAKNQQQQQQITSSESIESDSNDCNSEASTSTSKDETKLWPAWVSLQSFSSSN